MKDAFDREWLVKDPCETPRLGRCRGSWRHGIVDNENSGATAASLLVGGSAGAWVGGVYRESEQSWKALLFDVRARGLVVVPKLATADGALGF